jgi:hypothetical protein
LLPPTLATPYRRPSWPSVRPASGVPPSALTNGSLLLAWVNAGKVRRTSKPLPSKRTRKIVP